MCVDRNDLYEQEMLVAELVYSFLIPEVHKQEFRQKGRLIALADRKLAAMPPTVPNVNLFLARWDGMHHLYIRDKRKQPLTTADSFVTEL